MGWLAVLRAIFAPLETQTRWPIKFNGMAFVAAMGTNADYRDWGPSNWWQK